MAQTVSPPPASEADRIGQLAETGERMIDRLRQKAFLPESRKGLAVRYGIAEAAQLVGCSTFAWPRKMGDCPLPCRLKMAAAPATASQIC
jgi:hypothetical protein